MAQSLKDVRFSAECIGWTLLGCRRLLSLCNLMWQIERDQANLATSSLECWLHCLELHRHDQVTSQSAVNIRIWGWHIQNTTLILFLQNCRNKVILAKCAWWFCLNFSKLECALLICIFEFFSFLWHLPTILLYNFVSFVANSIPKHQLWVYKIFFSFTSPGTPDNSCSFLFIYYYL